MEEEKKLNLPYLKSLYVMYEEWDPEPEEDEEGAYFYPKSHTYLDNNS